MLTEGDDVNSYLQVRGMYSNSSIPERVKTIGVSGQELERQLFTL